ncbi:2-C-methyl-D-erythritol 4-phosphate cytidylyltransferase [Paenibacillus shirakamiensis]|uniref:2-C-methyl-D-erythritol 4-phosphate cytidylyltransferase n=1 Tax=Paenibacillus shirakamiensis TaxID=1265935 RepID=A0ABS4JLN3_9BACL|nr:2-C-methyl-D-erythritol 4-phosphate cytidylyltransferase [Paenibacillus shirakamiensis]MBP2002608.1 2-C-methyl-D-erythritol 4-phosphate cytidylyltransferase [Paenibacillus shirakamiensis]
MTNLTEAAVIVVAAGRGTRMGTRESKQYLQLDGKPIIVHTLEVFNRLPFIREIILVTGAQDRSRCQEWVRDYNLDKVNQVIEGGKERQDSVLQGLRATTLPWILIHDGVRPFVTETHIQACLDAAQESGASVLAVPVKDTVKQVGNQGYVTATPDRRSLWAIQTPQAFRHEDLLRAHEQAEKDGFMGTDDSMLIERIGIKVKVVEGSYGNIKLTTPEDLDYAQFIRTKAAKTGEDRA